MTPSPASAASAVLVYVPHTTAGVTINEHADPAVARDLEAALERMVDDGWPWEHVEPGEENAPTHVRAALMGPSVVVPLVEDGSLALGDVAGDLLLRVRRPARPSVYVTVLELTAGVFRMIEVEGLTKRYGSTLAVDDLSFTVAPGAVTGFLGPNGAGKSTTMRVDPRARPADRRAARRSSGARTVSSTGRRQRVGALLETFDAHPGRSGRNHLRVLATRRRDSRAPASTRCSRSSS